MRLRALTAADSSILSEATSLNLNWGGTRFSAGEVRVNPHFRHYTELVPARGDFGYLLEDDAGWVAVAWVLFLDRRDPGYGYIRDGVPELSICTKPSRRGRGHGSRLLSRILDGARRRRLAAIALSVEDGNPACRLYERMGFTVVPEAANPGTMILVTD
ncbi:GNAT family N-acetyltransferase [Leucobacter weissii]|uniref:GNAT family N-acetyltransferase n=1 Tax=Leucobacter weissii TaxID=1983706 RepID=A0A939MIN8_9MICO|nr:GNAT family N-acetyltransferase [Leucobacter weissii]MBO1901306.1 GNAT family N-acetyltransferase [Leucobacter weissii]